jgi:prevent-host-death family protein
MRVKTVGVSALRSNLLGILKKIEAGSEITITSRGREVARLVPVGDPKKHARKELETLRKTAIVGDVLSPVSEDWEILQ